MSSLALAEKRSQTNEIEAAQRPHRLAVVLVVEWRDPLILVAEFLDAENGFGATCSSLPRQDASATEFNPRSQIRWPLAVPRTLAGRQS